MNTFLRTEEFDSWLKVLRDPIAKPVFSREYVLLKQGILAIVHPLAKAFRKCAYMSGLVTGYITVAEARSFICYCAEETNRRKKEISKRQSAF